MFTKELNVAVEAAREAGRYQLTKYQTGVGYRLKGKADLVTEVDVACQKLILEKIRKAFPDHDVLAEEEGAARSTSRFRWHIDPLDGTTNFAHGHPMFCVSIALEVDQELSVGVIYHPIMDELFTAAKGKGAFLNSKRIHCTKIHQLDEALLATGFPPYSELGQHNVKIFGYLLSRCHAIRRLGAAALDLAWVACGRIDGFWELGLKPWDTAAGSVLIREAGGVLFQTSGKPFSIYEPDILACGANLKTSFLNAFEQFNKTRP